MKTLGIIVLILAAIFLILGLFLARNGLFATVEIAEKDAGPYLMVYARHIGDYKNVAPVMDALYHDLKDNFGIATTRGFGLYYDNPQEVAAEELRSIVGCIVDDKTIEELTEAGIKYQVAMYPASPSIVAQFPYKSQLSIILGIFKVYPKLDEYLTQQNAPKVPIIELYDQPNEKIQYIASTQLPDSVFTAFLE